MKSQRTVAEMDTALVLVESWLDDGVTDTVASSSLAPSSRRSGAPSTTEDQTIGENTPVSDGRKPPKTASRTDDTETVWQNALRLACLLWVGFDGSTWLGADLDGCRRLGPVCLGALLRYGYDFHLTGASSAQETRRHAGTLLFIVDFPLKWDVLRLTPGVGLGVGIVHSARKSDEGAAYVATGIFGNAQAEAHLILGIRMSRHVTFRFGPRIGVIALGETGMKIINSYKTATQPMGFARFSMGGQWGW